MRATRRGVLAFILVAALLTLGLSPQPRTYGQAPPSNLPSTQPGPILAPGGFPGGAGGGSLLNQLQAEAAQLAQRYSKVTKEEEKKELRRTLTDLLGQQFDQHMQQQQKELEELEKQLSNLRAVLKKRAEARTTIVERRTEQLLLEAEGLGWTTPSSPRQGGYGGFGFSRSPTSPYPTGVPAAK